MFSVEAEAIEVLCQKRAFVVKRIGQNPPDDHDVQPGQIMWSLHDGVAQAWETAKSFSFYE